MKQAVLIIALMLVAHTAHALTYTVEISEEDIQSRISALMPIERKDTFVTVVLSDATVDLAVGNNKIGFFSKIEVSVPGVTRGVGSVKIVGTLSYDRETHEFYFRNPEILDIELESVPANVLPVVKDVAQAAATEVLSRYPVYKLQDDNLRHRFIKSVLRSVRVVDHHIEVELETL